ncbi:MAG: Tad domain-containing protein [Selenomonadaceae bacterium]|nr:Tad domain-containing protein [Selenomonadaceae bacterium]MBQ3726181.1 Tad domain-containing protein [Selenomonadaceae bacterium]MBQ9497537.1 Tad domain-containing protein [Selenomonadaceae bacterium]
MLGSLKKKFRPEKGQVVVFTILLLPLILGVVVFVIEIGNIYVHYSDLQNIADTAAVTGEKTKARVVVERNIKNLSDKGKVADTKNEEPNKNFLVKPYEGKSTPQPADEFYVRLTKDIPLIFLKVFGETRKVEVNSASREGKLIPCPSNLTWEFITP